MAGTYASMYWETVYTRFRMFYTLGVLDRSSVDKVSTEKCISMSIFPSTVLEFGVIHGHPDGRHG